MLVLKQRGSHIINIITSAIPGYSCVIHMLLLCFTMAVWVTIITESSCFCQLGFGHILMCKSLTPIDSYFCMSLLISSFLSGKFEWPNQENLSVMENNKWTNIYRAIWCTLLSQDYHSFYLIKRPDASLYFSSN